MHSTEENFLNLISTHQHIIHKICFIYCRNKEDRQDMVQEIILQLWKSFPTFKGQSAFSTWMYRVALNTALSITKKPKLFVDAKADYYNVPGDDNFSGDMDEDTRFLYQAITTLNKVERAIILLWLEEHTYEEIAETIGISVKNVSVKLVRIKSKLKKTMKRLMSYGTY